MSLPAFQSWRDKGSYVDADGLSIFTIDEPAGTEEGNDPLLLLHGFPSCSFDWRHCLPAFAKNRRVVLLDFPGFGLSEKPDMRYSIRVYADAVEEVLKALDLDRFDLVTHDMGDTVGGELLARNTEGGLDITVGHRVVTNGSIYIGKANLTPGQQMLLEVPDESLPQESRPADWRESFLAGWSSTFAPGHEPSSEELTCQWEFQIVNSGYTRMARTIRYIEDRRAEEERFTGAIETHPSPLSVVWGKEDPVAVYQMALDLKERRPDATLTTLEGVGHYPMIEAPDQVSAAVLSALS